MPLFTTELNRIADDIGSADLTIYLHTSAPTNSNPANGRVSTGGGLYASGARLNASDISDASGGDIQNTSIIDFGTANANVGTVTHWSAYRGSTPIAYGSIPSTAIVAGDRFQINANSLRILGSTS